ncbi:ABC transporter substrate-binding protein [Bacillus sp. NTK071]|uniref:ABC transporter substrate-binding protein n=1 Tax=Bacillus sp. NTK071 TaxID=2802175 RepID=UPI001A8D09E9|nr:ABC transporter substrate-binding protein [Bacillus sp. NTK071]MBN8210271.1 ABC transporter substrate-binding protein [Bacillus sp. NTK071]
MKQFNFLILLIVVGISLVGCSSNAGTSSDEKQTTLIYGRGGDSVSLDPAVVTDGESFKVADNIYNTLVQFGDMDTEVHPDLATDWDVSDDGLQYTFQLQKDVTFHDGTAFNAKAVVFNFERWMNPKEDQAEPFAFYRSMFGGFKGDEDHVIKEVKATEDYTVQITLNRPQAPFLKNLSMTPFSIASPKALVEEGANYGQNPVGTGPFVFKEWKRNDKIVLEKNEDYWVEGYPKLERVIFKSLPDNAARLNALKTGEIDMMDGVMPSDVPQIEENADLKTFTRPSINIGYLGLNVTRGPLENKKVRQALNHAVDKDAIIEAFYEGQAEPAKNPIAPSIQGYNDEIDPYEYDLDEAKSLLEEAGYPDGFNMELWAMPVSRPYMPDGQKVAEAIQSSFKEIGVNATIKTYEWAAYVEKVIGGEADSFLLGWTAQNGDADNVLYTLLDKEMIGSSNSSRYESDELHKLLVDAQSTVNQEKRNELYKQALEVIHEDAPWIPLVHSTPVVAGKKNIEGFNPHPNSSVELMKVEFN